MNYLQHLLAHIKSSPKDATLIAVLFLSGAFPWFVYLLAGEFVWPFVAFPFVFWLMCVTLLYIEKRLK